MIERENDQLCAVFEKKERFLRGSPEYSCDDAEPGEWPQKNAPGHPGAFSKYFRISRGRELPGSEGFLCFRLLCFRGGFTGFRCFGSPGGCGWCTGLLDLGALAETFHVAFHLG